MTRSTTRRIARVGLAIVAATAIGGTVSGAGDQATSCPTWHPHTGAGGHQHHTWNPTAAAVPDQHTWNPDAAAVPHQHTWNPDAPAVPHQHTWNPTGAAAVRDHDTWNPDGHRGDACPSSSPTVP